MRVLMLNDLWDPRIGSSVRQMYQHAARLRELGHEVAVVSTSPRRDEVGTTEIQGTRVHRLHSDYPVRWRSWVALSHRALRAPFQRVLQEFRPDVAHSHLIHTHLSYAALTWARESGAAVVFTAHDSMTYCHQKLTCFHGGAEHGWQLKDYRAYWQKCLPCQRLRYNPFRNARIRAVLARDVDRLTVVSNELGAAVRANGIRVDRTIHNAIDLHERRPDEAALRAFRARWGLVDAQVIAIGGRLHEQKGVHELFLVLRALAERFPRLRLLVMGRREVYAGFEPRARELGVADRVVATGWLDGAELEAAYASTDVFVAPSICFETFGLVSLEAMEHAKPVVATCFGGSPEVIEDGVTGFIANPFDTERFAGKLAELLADPALAARMGQAGRKRLEQHFLIPRLAQEFLEEYALALARRRATPVSPVP
jgi:glycosyltransferase involved in cell wall biosynthesis